MGRFTSKYNLSYRRITHLCLKTPSELENDVLDFLSELHKLRKALDIPPENILNFDEMALYYDQIPAYTYDKKGTGHPLLKLSKLQKKRLTVGLTITSSGEKLRPLLIFKGKGSRINKLSNFNDYFVRKNENAWNTNKIFLEYLHQIVKPFILGQKQKEEFKDKKVLLIMDNFSAHKIEDEKMKELEEFGLMIRNLKPYTINICQPLDLNINYLVKSQMKEAWMNWFGINSNVNPTKQIIYSWFVKAFKGITPLSIIKAFLMSGISNELDGTSDILCPNLVTLRKKEKKQQMSME